MRQYIDKEVINLSNGLSKELRDKISLSMKKAHREGRAHNIGKSRWNNSPSYPEKFFMRVIENEFSDKNYVREYPIGIYSIDFAWIDKKIAIEIDGQQHDKKEYRERDKRKNKLLNEKGWKVLRIRWEDMMGNSKYWISLAKNFVDEQTEHIVLMRDTIGEELDFSYLQKTLGIEFQLNSAGRRIGIETKKIEQNKKIIMESNIDFSKQGWVEQVSKLLGVTPQYVNRWMRKNMYDFWKDNCFKRKGTKF